MRIAVQFDATSTIEMCSAKKNSSAAVDGLREANNSPNLTFTQSTSHSGISVKLFAIKMITSWENGPRKFSLIARQCERAAPSNAPETCWLVDRTF